MAAAADRLNLAALLGRIANEMIAVSVVLLGLERGESLAFTGLLVAALSLPGIVTGPIVGAWLDRSPNPLRVIAAEQLAGGLGLLAIAGLLGNAPRPAVIAVALLAGALQPLSTGGLTSLIAVRGGPAGLARQSSFEAASFGAANVVGPLLAAVLASAAGPAFAVLVQALLKLVSMALTLSARLDANLAPGRPVGVPLWRTVLEGFRHFAGDGALRAVTVTGLVALAGRGLLVVAFPVYAVDVLGRTEEFGGYLWAAFAVGSTFGALALSARVARWPAPWVAVTGAAPAGIAMAMVSITDMAGVAVLALVLSGFVYGPSLAATIAVRGERTPGSLLGQVYTTATSLKWGGFAIGAAASGSVVAALGSADAILVAAAVSVAATVAGAVLLKGAG